MPDLVPSITFTARESGDGTWYVEVVSPSIAYEDVGDFRSKASAEAWIRENLQSYAANLEAAVKGAPDDLAKPCGSNAGGPLAAGQQPDEASRSSGDKNSYCK
jgi:hypothetical protein